MHFHWPPCPQDVQMFVALIGTYLQFFLVWTFKAKAWVRSFI